MNTAQVIAKAQEALAAVEANTAKIDKVFGEVSALKQTAATLTDTVAALEAQIAAMDQAPQELVDALAAVKAAAEDQAGRITAIDDLNTDAG